MSFSLGDLIQKSTVKDESGNSSFSLGALQNAVIGGAVKTADEVISRGEKPQASQTLEPQKAISQVVADSQKSNSMIYIGALVLIGGLIYWRMKK